LFQRFAVCVVGFRALVADKTIESELNYPCGEWMSPVHKLFFNGPATACLTLESTFVEDGSDKRVSIELIYQDVNDIIRTSSLFDYKLRNIHKGVTTLSGSFEFYMKDVLQYQVCIFLHLVVSEYFSNSDSITQRRTSSTCRSWQVRLLPA